MFDVDDFVAGCRSALSETSAAPAVKEILDRALADPSSIDAALGGPKPGGVYPLHVAEDLTVLQIVWPPHVELFPHDHRMWAANGIYRGQEDNTFFRRGDDGGLVASGGKELVDGDSVVLGREVIHSVTNPRGTHTAAIHVYGGDFFATPRSEWDPVTLAEQPFDVEHLKTTLAQAEDAAGRG